MNKEGKTGSSDAQKQMAKLIGDLEVKRKSTVIPLLFTDGTSLDRTTVTDIYDFLEFKRKLGKVKHLDVILHSSGGDLDAAVHLTEILRSYSDNLNLIVPRFAKSAATLVALSGNSLILDKPSELGPLDPVWMGEEEDYSPLALPKTIEFLKDLERKLPKDSNIIKIIAEGLSVERMGVYKASLDDAVEPLTELLATRMFNGKSNGRNLARKIAQRLTRGYPQHGYPITLGEAQKLGIGVTKMPPDEWLLVWKTYKCFEETYLR